MCHCSAYQQPLVTGSAWFCPLKKLIGVDSPCRHPGEGRDPAPVLCAVTYDGHDKLRHWVPAFAGMTIPFLRGLRTKDWEPLATGSAWFRPLKNLIGIDSPCRHPGERRDPAPVLCAVIYDGRDKLRHWVPAFAGMTITFLRGLRTKDGEPLATGSAWFRPLKKLIGGVDAPCRHPGESRDPAPVLCAVTYDGHDKRRHWVPAFAGMTIPFLRGLRTKDGEPLATGSAWFRPLKKLIGVDSLGRHPGEGRDPAPVLCVVAYDGHDKLRHWVPAFAGMTIPFLRGLRTKDGEPLATGSAWFRPLKKLIGVDSLGRHPGEGRDPAPVLCAVTYDGHHKRRHWVPAFAGMTIPFLRGLRTKDGEPLASESAWFRPLKNLIGVDSPCRHPGEGRDPAPVLCAVTYDGHDKLRHWVPAFAGMTITFLRGLRTKDWGDLLFALPAPSKKRSRASAAIRSV